MSRVIPVESEQDIPTAYRNTPIERLLAYHNLGTPLDTYTSAALLIGMCMDHRNTLRIPNNFAYIIRAGGANLRYSKFTVSYAIAVGGVQAIALIAHTNCGMVNVVARRDAYVQGMIENGGWSREQAEEEFLNYAPFFEIENEITFALEEAQRLRARYPKLPVAALLYNIEDHRLYVLDE